MYFLQGKVDLTYEEDGKTELINDLEEYLKQNNGDIGNIGEGIKGDISVFLENNLKKYLDELHDKKLIRYTKIFTNFLKGKNQFGLKILSKHYCTIKRTLIMLFKVLK
jgi:hypothetical protein